MSDECHHICELISIVDNSHKTHGTYLVFLPRHLLPCKQNYPSVYIPGSNDDGTARDLQATAICARLAFFWVGESEGVGSSMVTLESHGTSDEGAAGDLDHRDVVRSKCWQSRA